MIIFLFSEFSLLFSVENQSISLPEFSSCIVTLIILYLFSAASVRGLWGRPASECRCFPRHSVPSDAGIPRCPTGTCRNFRQISSHLPGIPPFFPDIFLFYPDFIQIPGLFSVFPDTSILPDFCRFRNSFYKNQDYITFC